MNITLSIVSHSQTLLVTDCLQSMDKFLICKQHKLSVIITENTREAHKYSSKFPISVVQNLNKKGFGQNHNSAFERKESDFFLIINPDIKFNEIFNLDKVINDISTANVDVTAPVIVNEFGEIEDYKRSDLTLQNLILRNVFRQKEQKHDWYAGMFLIISGKCFANMSGFDPQFFMYVEDCDFCMRARAAGYKIEDVCQNRVVHNARRNSRRSVKYMFWHISSLLKYWFKGGAGG